MSGYFWIHYKHYTSNLLLTLCHRNFIGTAHSRGVKLNDHCGHFQPRPFYNSMTPPMMSLMAAHLVLSFSQKQTGREPQTNDSVVVQ